MAGDLASALFFVLTAGGLSILAVAILLSLPALAGLIAAVTLYALSQMLTRPLVHTAVNKLAPTRLRATYIAATSVASEFRDSVGLATATALYAASARLPWMLAIPFAALAAVGLGTTIARQQRPPTPSPGDTPTGSPRPRAA